MISTPVRGACTLDITIGIQLYACSSIGTFPVPARVVDAARALVVPPWTRARESANTINTRAAVLTRIRVASIDDGVTIRASVVDVT